MALVTTKEMFKKAYDGGYAIGAFNVNNMEIIQGITEAAIEEKAPLILQVSKGARAYAKHVYLMKLIEAAIADAEQTAGFDLPICVHLDHGDSFELCKSCIDGGFTSVMIDGSSKSFKDNIALTKQVVDYAHDHGVVVEGELGTLAGVEDEVKVSAEDSSYTRPEEVEEFVSKTGVDSLAIAIGTCSRRLQVHRRSVHPQRAGHAGAPAAALRHSGRGFQASAWLPHRAARLFFRSAGIREDDQPVRRQDARRRGYPRGAAAQGRQHVRVQDQHRLRSAPGHDRLHPPALRGASGSLRSRASTSSPPAWPSRTWSSISWWTCWVCNGKA